MLVSESRRCSQHERGTVAEEGNLPCFALPGSGNENGWVLLAAAHSSQRRAATCGKARSVWNLQALFMLRLFYFSSLSLKYLSNIPKFWHLASFSILHLQGRLGRKFTLALWSPWPGGIWSQKKWFRDFTLGPPSLSLNILSFVGEPRQSVFKPALSNPVFFVSGFICPLKSL